MNEENRTILVVDDDRASITLLKRLLESVGHWVISAGDGREALKTLFEKVGDIDLVLLDIMMPGMDGLEVCRRIQFDSHLSHCPVILMTASASSEFLTEGFQAGAMDFVKKPISEDELLARLNSALRLRSAQQKLIESEKRAMFGATVVTANHEINQPLHTIMANLELMQDELKKPAPERERLDQYCRGSLEGVVRISKILQKLSALESPTFKEYARGVPMVDLDGVPLVLEPSTQAPEAIAPPLDGYILAVEDDPEILKLTTDMMRSVGYKCLAAGNGREALDIFRRRGHEIRLVLTDIRLPGLPGDQLAREIRSLDPSVKIIFNSAYDDDVVERIKREGRHPLLQKPYQARQLLEAIEKSLEAAPLS